MSTLILTLPLPGANGTPEYAYVLSPDGQPPLAQGHAAAALLPALTGRGGEVVAVVPAQALSWHGITLPERVLRGLLSGRSDAARSRSVLAGALEDQLLDDPDQLHFAVFAGSASSDEPNAWVAVCARAWLQTHLQALETAGRPVGRIVAEATPSAPGSAQAMLCDGDAPVQLLLCTPQGVSRLPLQSSTLELALAHSTLEVQAEPAVMALAQQHFGQAVRLCSRTERLLQAAQSPWNLAQLEQSASRSGRLAKRLGALWQQLLHAPAWQAARWSLAALLLVQLIGLNALAWQLRQQQAQTHQAIAGVLQRSFPEVRLVVDAPQQMQRAMDDLARARGAGADALPGRVLAVLASLTPARPALGALDWDGRQLQLRVGALDAAGQQTLTQALEAQGLRGQWQGDQLQVTRSEGRP